MTRARGFRRWPLPLLFAVLLLPSCARAQDAAAQVRDGLPRATARLRAGGAVRVAFLGGSITHSRGWRDLVTAWLGEAYPTARIEAINAGIPSMGSTPGAFRLQHDVLDRGPIDLLLVEAAVNDRTNGRTTREMRRALEGIVRRARGAGVDVALLHFVDASMLAARAAGEVPPVIAAHEAVAEHYGAPSVDLSLVVHARIEAGETHWRDDFRDPHPQPDGQRLYGDAIRGMLERALAILAPEAAKSLPPVLEPGCYDRGRIVDVAGVEVGSGWRVVPSWRPADGAGTRPGYVDVPVLEATAAGDALGFRFSGDAVGILITSGPDAGVVEHRIDGGAWQRTDLMTRWSRGLHLPWTHVLAAGLTDGDHVLELRVIASPEGRVGAACRIHGFVVNGAP